MKKMNILKLIALSLLSTVVLTSCKNSNTFRYEYSEETDSYFVCSDMSLTERNTITGTITIPSSYSFKPVSSIAPFSFYECRLIESFTISEGIKNIESYSFAKCNSLFSIELPTSIEKIDSCAFYNSGLLSIYIPKNVSFVGKGAFALCSLQEIVIDSENEYFVSDENVNAIIYKEDNRLITGSAKTVIPSYVTKLDDYSFSGCKGLEEIVIPGNVLEIGAFAFSSCSSLKKINIEEGVRVINANAFSDTNSLEEINIPNSIEKVLGTFEFGKEVVINFAGTKEQFLKVYSKEITNNINCTDGIIQ